MDYNLEIHTYLVVVNFNAPLASSPNNHIQLKTGDTLISIDDYVYIENKDPENIDPKNFTKALFKKNFIDINPTIFKLKL